MANAGNAEKIRQFFDEVFSHENFEFIDQIVAPKYSFNGQPSSADKTKTWAKRKTKRYRNLAFSIMNLVENGNQVSFEWKMTGENLDEDAKSVSKEGRNTLTFENGLCTSNQQTDLEAKAEFITMKI